MLVVKDQVLAQWVGGNNSAPWNLGSDSAIAAYKVAVDEVVAEFSTGVYSVEVPNWNKTTMICSDICHPNDRGVDAYAAAVENVLASLSWRTGQNTL